MKTKKEQKRKIEAVLEKAAKKVVMKKISPTPPKVKMEEVSTAVIISDLEKEAKPTFNKLAKITAIKTQEDFEQAGEHLKFLKSLAAKAVEQENKLTEGLKLSLIRIRGHFKPFQAMVASTETSYKLLMSVYLVESKKKLAAIDEKFSEGSMKVSTYAKKVAEVVAPSSKSGAQVRRVWTAVVVDEKKIPREFMVPDMSAITAAFKENPDKKIAGVEWKQVENIAI